MTTEDIKEQSTEIFNHLFKIATPSEFTYEEAMDIRRAVIEATGQIMQAQIMVECLNEV